MVYRFWGISLSGFKAQNFFSVQKIIVLLFIPLVLLSLGCERIPELERKILLGKSSENSRHLFELKKWLWTCRGQTTTSFSKGRREIGERIEEFVDYFQSKGLSTVTSESASTLLGTAVLWKESGYLLSALSNFAETKEVECSNGILPWTKAVVKGFDRALDLAVLKLDSSATPQLKSYIRWVERTDVSALDESYSVLSTPFPGQVDRFSVQIQPVISSMHTGIDDDLILFLPPIPEVSAGGLLVDSTFKVVGYLLPHQGTLWGAALSLKRADFSVNSIIETGKVLQPYTGMKLRVQAGGGFSVQQIEVGSPAYRAGLRVDDIVLKWNKINLKTLSDWQEITANEIGRTIPITYEHGDKTIEGQITVLSAE
ncbi:MAG: serine protease DegS [Bacteriovoracaceae bacterium]|nr:serine protease DegS [Bacteriovoracaceae bacterium]